ncbi:hypothetical protein [Streptomyces virginiae]|uniref:hypothetical protein n=1 Tax=Streptomyces virginiae TaxID=1961 RepID=UPI002255300F|nr:hypothetical protein [Streptomyces virginiae]MCX5275035.1 hypothetical protein [Streptomyces virginiae]
MATRDGSDEAYVVGLCERILGENALPQHRFDWLLGDPGSGGRRVQLPVDAFWPGHQLVVEYRELQHDQPMPHFDKPNRLTVSGVHRGEQRACTTPGAMNRSPRTGCACSSSAPPT